MPLANRSKTWHKRNYCFSVCPRPIACRKHCELQYVKSSESHIPIFRPLAKTRPFKSSPCLSKSCAHRGRIQCLRKAGWRKEWTHLFVWQNDPQGGATFVHHLFNTLNNSPADTAFLLSMLYSGNKISADPRQLQGERVRETGHKCTTLAICRALQQKFSSGFRKQR